jgi:hypothetical protein
VRPACSQRLPVGVKGPLSACELCAALQLPAVAPGVKCCMQE